MTRVISLDDLRGLFTKPYGTDAPTKEKWAKFYSENVIFVDPTLICFLSNNSHESRVLLAILISTIGMDFCAK